MSDWKAFPEVRSPVGRSIEDLLERRPRRQPMPGFDDVYSDFVDYIIRCTHRIWEEKDVGLCRTHYGPDCVVHTMAGETRGMEAVVQNTIGSLATSSDRQVIGEDVIWSADPDDVLYSSHRIISSSTHLGDDVMIGPATRRQTGVMTIADCACRENRIVEEWLVRDNLRAVEQVGLDGWAVAQELAKSDVEGDPARHAWRAAELSRIRRGEDVAIDPDHPAAPLAAMLRLALRDDLYGEAAARLSPAVEIRWPTNRRGFGRGYWIGCFTQVRAALHSPALSIDHVAARPLPGNDIAVAIRWSLAGIHGGGGIWGQPTGRNLAILAVSHYRVRAGLVVEDATVFDELSVLRQIAGGLGG